MAGVMSFIDLIDVGSGVDECGRLDRISFYCNGALMGDIIDRVTKWVYQMAGV